MSKIIKMKLPNEEIIEVPDLEYVNQCIDGVKNNIRECILASQSIDPKNKVYGLAMTSMKIEPEIKELDLTKSKVRAEEVEQDGSHRMITDAQILLFKNKPTLQEVDDRIKSIAVELKETIERMFTNVLNLPEALSKLQQIAELFANSPLNTEDGIRQILDKFEELKEELQDHIESGKHVNNNERKALNLTIDLVNNGMLDKVCSGTVPHANKADDADSLNGVSLENIRARHLEEVVYGMQPYDKNLVDVLFDKSSILDSLFNNTHPTNGIIGFKPGTYDNFNIFNIKSESDLIVNGSGYNSTIIITKEVLTRNNTIRDISFRGTINDPCVISIFDNTNFNNCKFINCNINIAADYNIRFTNCEFSNVKKFDISKGCTNIIIQNNTFDLNSKIPQSIGITNRIIKDNLTKY